MALEKLILYKSYAKGTTHKDSDIDMAVIVDAISRDYFSTRPLL